MEAPAPIDRAFVHRRFVYFADTDMAGIVHFANYFRFMEEAEHAFVNSRGVRIFEQHDGMKLTWPRVAAKCDYKSPARYEDWLDIAVRIDRFGISSITYGFEMTTAGRLVATGQVTAVCCRINDDHSVSPVAIPQTILARLKNQESKSDTD